MAKKVKRSTETAPLKWQEAQNLLKLLKADNLHERRLMFAFGFYTGLRISDILRLTWGQVSGVKAFTITERKTSKTRTIQINDDLAAIVREARAALKPADDGVIFRSKRGRSIGAPLTVFGALKWISETLSKYGIKTQNPSSHTLRKTFGRRVYELNGETEKALVLLSDIFNHSNAAITRRYIGITRETIENVYLAL